MRRIDTYQFLNLTLSNLPLYHISLLLSLVLFHLLEHLLVLLFLLKLLLVSL